MPMFGGQELSEELVRAAAQGCDASREKLIASLEAPVRSMVIVRLAARAHQFHAVEDICQDVLTAISQGLERLQTQTTDGLKCYASSVVSRRVADFLRRPRRTAASLESTVRGGSAPNALRELIPGTAQTPRSAAAHAEELRRLVDQIGRLKESHARVITLAFFDQLPLIEVARELALSHSAASMLLIRAVRALRRGFEDDGVQAASRERPERE